MITKEIEDYITEHTSEENPLLQELYRETHLKVMHPRMLSGHVQGVFLQMISKMVRPQYILEIGTYTGYSALCLAEGLAVDGILHTIEVNEEVAEFAAKFFSRSDHQQQIKQHVGQALDIIGKLDYTFDIVFIDADKENYLNYYLTVIDKVRPGGIILADNALWDGKVVDNSGADSETRGIIEFNDHVHGDGRVTNLLLPLRDGIMILQKNA